MSAHPGVEARPGARPPGAGAPAARRRWTLRLRLTLLTSGLLAVALVVGAVALTTVLSRSRLGALDALLVERVGTVAALVATDQVPPALPAAQPGEVVQLLDADGLVVATSPNASRTLPVLPLAELAGLRDTPGPGPTLRTTEASAYGSPARVAVLQTTHRGRPVSVVATLPLGEVQGLLGALRVALVVVVPLLTALLALAIWVTLGRALHPVDQLRRAAAQVAGTGGGGTLPVPRADDELRALALTLNEMLDRLEVGAARQRSFVADAAHELRSPLAALRTSVEVAVAHPEAYRDPDAAAELAADLACDVLRLQDLVDDLLLLARMGAAPVPSVEVDLLTVVDRAVADSRARAGTARPVRVEVSGQGRAHGDAAALARVVRNLLDNAVRHAGSRVQVHVADGCVAVDDDGTGVPVTDRERVFERFVRLDEAREREAGGSGLGLAIAREIAREHGGDVVLGTSPLGGLVATLRLVPPPDAARQPRRA